MESAYETACCVRGVGRVNLTLRRLLSNEMSVATRQSLVHSNRLLEKSGALYGFEFWDKYSIHLQFATPLHECHKQSGDTVIASLPFFLPFYEIYLRQFHV